MSCGLLADTRYLPTNFKKRNTQTVVSPGSCPIAAFLSSGILKAEKGTFGILSVVLLRDAIRRSKSSTYGPAAALTDVLILKSLLFWLKPESLGGDNPVGQTGDVELHKDGRKGCIVRLFLPILWLFPKGN